MKGFRSSIANLINNLIFLFLFGAASAPILTFAARDLSWHNDPSLPPCPKTGVRILDDTYPAIAHIINPKIALEFMTAVNAANNPAPLFQNNLLNQPLILVEASDQNYLKMKSQLSHSDQNRLLQVPEKNIQDVYQSYWYQDLFEVFFNSSTGSPVIARLSSDDSEGDDTNHQQVKNIAAAFKKNLPEFMTGKFYLDTFVNWDKVPENSETDGQTNGGDIEALPGGYCLHGNNQYWDMLPKKYCGNHDNEVIVDTSWLEVGHVDEIISVIPLRPSGQAGLCDFAIAIPDPALALSLMTEKDWQSQNLLKHLKEFKQDKDSVEKTSREAIDHIAQTKKIILSKIQQRLPECQIQFIGLPVLYVESKRTVFRDGNLQEIPASVALTANVINAVKQGPHYIAEDPIFPSFRISVEQSLSQIGVQTHWIHQDLSINHGSVHCYSHTVRVCRP